MVPTFLEIESYDLSEKQSSSILPETEKRTLNLLQETAVNKNIRHTVSLLWDSDYARQTNNNIVALSRLFSLERNLANNQELAQRDKEAMEDAKVRQQS